MNRLELPDLGEGLEDARIVEWYVQTGDTITAGQPLVSVETAKAVVDIPAPVTGVVIAHGAESGKTVAVGDILAEIDDENGVEIRKPYSGIVGDIPLSSHPAQERTGPTISPRETERSGSDRKSAAISATPAVRSAAAASGIDLTQIKGTGPGKSISMDDLHRFTNSESAQLQPDMAVSDAVHSVSETGRGVSARKRMADNMRRSGDSVVPSTVTEVADVHDWPANTDTMVRLIDAVVHACEHEPGLNAFFDDDTKTRSVHTSIDLGLAVETSDGLFVPVFTDAGNRSAAERLEELDQLLNATRAGTIRIDQMTRPTITLSNFGSLGGLYASLIVVPPQCAIIGTGKIRPTVVPAPDGISVRRTLPISLTFDHRAVTGGEALSFLSAFIESLEADIRPVFAEKSKT